MKNLLETKKQVHTRGFLHGFERRLPYGLCHSSPRPQTMAIWQVRRAKANSQTFQVDFNLSAEDPTPSLSVMHTHTETRGTQHRSISLGFVFAVLAILGSIQGDVALFISAL